MLSCYIHVPTVAKSSLPILVSANEAPGTLASLIHTVFYHFCSAVHGRSENSLACSAAQTPGTGGIIFSSGEPGVRRQNYILISEREERGRRLLCLRLFTICSANNLKLQTKQNNNNKITIFLPFNTIGT